MLSIHLAVLPCLMLVLSVSALDTTQLHADTTTQLSTAATTPRCIDIGNFTTTNMDEAGNATDVTAVPCAGNATECADYTTAYHGGAHGLLFSAVSIVLPTVVMLIGHTMCS